MLSPEVKAVLERCQATRKRLDADPKLPSWRRPGEYGKITERLIEAGKSRYGAWSAEQFYLLGVAWPPEKGWKERIIGTDIDEHDAEVFVQLKNAHLPSE